MTFDELLDRVYYIDSECFQNDVLWVIISHKTKEKFVLHNANINEYYDFVYKYNPIFVAYNAKGYDRYIWKACSLGYTPEEVKNVNDFIISGNNGWEYPFGEYCQEPIWIDLMDDIVPRKSLKELEGCMFMDITETTVDFTIKHKLTKQELEEVIFYCTRDVEALIELMKRRIDYYKAKFTICEMGDIDPCYGLSLTNAKLTALFLGAERIEHNDKHAYTFPSNFETEKILPEVKEYFDKFIRKELDVDEVSLPLKIDEMRGKASGGGLHLAIDNYIFVSDDFNLERYYE